MTAIRWGLIGATVIGREWMIGAIREAGGEIVAVMSTDSDRGRAYAEEFGIPLSVTNLRNLFASGIDAVYISTTNERHRAETIAAAEAGIHVLCEKPFATSLADARAMVRACRKAPVSSWRPIIISATRAIASGDPRPDPGRPHRPPALRRGWSMPAICQKHLHGWRLTNPTAGAGAILDLTVHDADLLRFILDDEPARDRHVSARMAAWRRRDRRRGAEPDPVPLRPARAPLRWLHNKVCRDRRRS